MNQSNPLVDLSKSRLQSLSDPQFERSGIKVELLRIDEINPVISGNKWFKLKYALEKIVNEHYTGLITQGGAFSNHLMASAYACKNLGVKSVGIIRGEAPKTISPTLRDLQDYGMELIFVNREVYKDKSALLSMVEENYNSYYWVEEGGRSKAGVLGASEILPLASPHQFSHILCAVGTGTMMAGIVNSSSAEQKIIGIPVLKIIDTDENEITQFLRAQCNKNNYELVYDFHFGGYAKTPPELIAFMNDFYKEQVVPTDQVYTAKLLRAVYQLAKDCWFPIGSRLLVIHSGGLQGNRSLPPGTLLF